MSSTEPVHRRARTKIVATVGPASRTSSQLKVLIDAGVDVFRVNTAHGSREEHEAVVDAIRRASAEAGRPIGILTDLAGPKIRLGQLREDPTVCDLGAQFTLVRRAEPASPDQLTSNYEPLVDELDVGDIVMLADGTVGMAVIDKQPDSVVCQVTGAGTIRSRQGINLPGVRLGVPAMTEKDLSNAAWAAENGIDFVSLSFVRTATEIRQLKDLLRKHNSTAMVIAKIEKREALNNLDEIVAAADGIMVARGDLGVEIEIAETPIAQKRIIDTCRRLVKPVIVATQMLDSMHRNRRPTRAEATDVANAILDGADACMLSGETAIGQYPVESVEMMNRIMLATEGIMVDQQPCCAPSDVETIGVDALTAAAVYGAGRIAARLSARLVVIVSRSGATAIVKAKQREPIPSVGVSDKGETLRQMNLFWGIIPLPGAPWKDGIALRGYIDDWGKADGCLAAGDRVVYVTGSHVDPSAHNLLAIQEVQ